MFQQGIIGQYQIYSVDGVNGRLTLHYVLSGWVGGDRASRNS
jgi:hypothetical protein